MVAVPAWSADKGAKWGYKGASGPGNQAKLHQKNKVCSDGKRQSPFNIAGANRAPEKAGQMKYTAADGHVVNNGHTIQVNLDKGSALLVDGKPYRLVQFHFDTPSEHHLFDKGFPMEMHLVHTSADGKLAVVGVMVRAGGNGKHAIDSLPLPASAKADLPGGKINPDRLLPAHRSHFRFDGSLTTPPCSEGVARHMMITPVRVKAETRKKFRAIMGENNRPLQLHNNRAISHRR